MAAILWIASLAGAQCENCAANGHSEGQGHADKAACSDSELASYFQVQTGLASDNLEDAKKGAQQLLAAAEKMGCSLDGKSCCLEEIEAAEAIAKASDIKVARTAFKEWSNALIAKVEAGGKSESTIFQMHCPMAFGNKGGTWLQNSEDLKNPYYGAMMLKCGMIRKEYR